VRRKDSVYARDFASDPYGLCRGASIDRIVLLRRFAEAANPQNLAESLQAVCASKIERMSDAFSLSLWYTQFRLVELEEKLTAILRQFAAHGGEPGVFSATVWPVNWREAAAFQEIYGLGEHGAQI
jgi:hypothetical protein